jgi:hypothetical protein
VGHFLGEPIDLPASLFNEIDVVLFGTGAHGKPRWLETLESGAGNVGRQCMVNHREALSKCPPKLWQKSETR